MLANRSHFSADTTQAQQMNALDGLLSVVEALGEFILKEGMTDLFGVIADLQEVVLMPLVRKQLSRGQAMCLCYSVFFSQHVRSKLPGSKNTPYGQFANLLIR